AGVRATAHPSPLPLPWKLEAGGTGTVSSADHVLVAASALDATATPATSSPSTTTRPRSLIHPIPAPRSAGTPLRQTARFLPHPEPPSGYHEPRAATHPGPRQLSRPALAY